MVIVVTLALKFFARGMLSVAAVLIGILAGYAVAFAMGMVDFGNVGRAAAVALPKPFHFGIEFTAAAIIGFCAMAFVSAVETVGDVSGITKGGANREATDEEIKGQPTLMVSAAVSGFWRLAKHILQPKCGGRSMTGVAGRHVVTIGAILLIVAGLGKVDAIISTIPIEVWVVA